MTSPGDNEDDDQKIKPDASINAEDGTGGGGYGGAGGMRNVTALGVVSFFTDFSTEMVLVSFHFLLLTPLALHGHWLE